MSPSLFLLLEKIQLSRSVLLCLKWFGLSCLLPSQRALSTGRLSLPLSFLSIWPPSLSYTSIWWAYWSLWPCSKTSMIIEGQCLHKQFKIIIKVLTLVLVLAFIDRLSTCLLSPLRQSWILRILNSWLARHTILSQRLSCRSYVFFFPGLSRRSSNWSLLRRGWCVIWIFPPSSWRLLFIVSLQGAFINFLKVLQGIRVEALQYFVWVALVQSHVKPATGLAHCSKALNIQVSGLQGLVTLFYIL